jgi:excisionase family DNA binding protein
MTLSRRSVEGLISSGALPSSKIGRRRIIDRNDVDAYIARHREAGVGGAA